MTALYNEIDPKAAAWLRALIDAGHIAPGIVDERSIEDLTPDYLLQFTQVHFFAGIGVWSYALRAAGWPDDRPVWTGSCPCQPFSAAGKGGGFDDERHLWPAFHWLIAQCQPPVVFGEQVASKDGLGWLDLVQADLEGSGYASGAVDLCAAGVGAPHIRQRLWWFGERLADAESIGGRSRLRDLRSPGNRIPVLTNRGPVSRLGDDDDARLERRRGRHQAEGGWIGAAGPTAEAGELGGLAHHHGDGQSEGLWGRSGEPKRDLEHGRDESRLADANRGECIGLPDGQGCRGDRKAAGRVESHGEPECGGADGRLADTPGAGRQERLGHAAGRDQRGGAQGLEQLAGRGSLRADHGEPAGNADGPGEGVDDRLCDVAARPGPVNGFWGDVDWLYCRDGKWRPVRSGAFPLANGVAERVGLLRGSGNAIVASAAQAFIEAYLDATVI